MRDLLNSLTDRIHRDLSKPWAGEANLVGTMIDRHIVKLAGVGDHADEAVLVFLEAIRNASQTSPLFNRLWKTIRDDKTVDLWHYDHDEQWRSLSFEIRFERAFPPEDLYMVVSTFVPFGIGGDQSHYLAEQSTAYIRSTQDLRAVVNLQTRRTVRDTTQQHSSTESNDSSAWTNDSAHRTSTTRTGTTGARVSSSSGSSGEDSVRNTHGVGLFLQPKVIASERTTTNRGTWSNERTHEQKWEDNSSASTERSQSDRRHHEESNRSSSTELSEQLVEVTEDVSFTAVGPDFTRPEELLKAWRADPGNAESSMTIDMLLCALPAMSRIIEQGVAHRRMASRARRHSGAALDFWTEAGQLIAKYNPTAFGERVVCKHDGYMHPIRREDLARALEATQHQSPQLAPRSMYLLGDR